MTRDLPCTRGAYQHALSIISSASAIDDDNLRQYSLEISYIVDQATSSLVTQRASAKLNYSKENNVNRIPVDREAELLGFDCHSAARAIIPLVHRHYVFNRGVAALVWLAIHN